MTHGGAGPETAFDITDLERTIDPYPVFQSLRERGGVVKTPSGFWCTTTYDVSMDCLRHPGLSSGMIAERCKPALPPGAARDEMTNRIIFLDT